MIEGEDWLEKFLAKISSFEEEEELDLEEIFKPRSFEEYIGQEETKKILRITINAAKAENRPLPNLLLSGGFGLGKTVLAELIMKEYDREPVFLDGNSANKNPPTTGTIIIDEAHNLTPETTDTLNRYLDTNKLHLIGCTTDPGKLSGAFRSRFRHLNLRNYTVSEISEIAKKVCMRKGVPYTDEVIQIIARRSRFNARQVINYLSTIFDFLVTSGKLTLDKETVIEVFNVLEVDENGYTQRDRNYVRQMPDRPVGLGWLSAVLGVDKTTIEEEIEPYLLQTGVIDRTPKGRFKLKGI